MKMRCCQTKVKPEESVDLLIISDENDDIQRYIHPIVESFKCIIRNMTLVKTSPWCYISHEIPQTKRLLLLLHGSTKMASQKFEKWRSYIDKQNSHTSNHLIITIMGEQAESNQEMYGGMNIVPVKNIDHIEEWLPAMVMTFFSLKTNHSLPVCVRNLSPGYVIADDTAQILHRTLSRLGVRSTCIKDSDGSYNHTNCELIICVVRSKIATQTESGSDLQKLRLKHKPKYIISTQLNSIKASMLNGDDTVFGKPDTIRCIITLMANNGVIADHGHTSKGSNFVDKSMKSNLCPCFTVIVNSIYMFILVPFPLVVLLMFAMKCTEDGKVYASIFLTSLANGTAASVILILVSLMYVTDRLSFSTFITIYVLTIFIYIGIFTLYNVWNFRRNIRNYGAQNAHFPFLILFKDQRNVYV